MESKSDATRQTNQLDPTWRLYEACGEKTSRTRRSTKPSALCCLKGMLLEASFSKSLNQSQRDTLETYVGMICCLSWN